MKTRPNRKNEIEKVRRERLTFFNQAYKLTSNGANVYAIVEYNGKFFIYDNRSNKEWPPSEAMLVSRLVLNERYTNHAKERYYPTPERSTPDDIRGRIDRNKERSRAKQKKKGQRLICGHGDSKGRENISSEGNTV